jgi:hypothetical protein
VSKVLVPVSLLIDTDLTPSAKVIWMTLRARGACVKPGKLATITSLTQPTIRRCLQQLSATGWYETREGAVVTTALAAAPTPTQVAIPTGLLADSRVRPHGRLIYGLLQTLPSFTPPSGQFSHTILSRLWGISVVTIRQAIRDLADAGWLTATQANRKAPVQFVLCDLDTVRSQQEVADAAARLESYDFNNEAIMKEYLSLLIDSDNFADNVRPGFLVNPQTKQRLELDRYYLDIAGFEYNGEQHQRTTKRFPSEIALSNRQFRDLVKEALCQRRGISLVVITRRDLTLRRMQEKVGNLLPLRDLHGHEALIKYLERLRK